MSYGFSIKKANGAVKLDSNSFGALFSEALTVQANIGIFTKSYPNLVGMSLKALGDGTKYISYPGGVPTFSVNSNALGGTTTFYLFVV